MNRSRRSPIIMRPIAAPFKSSIDESGNNGSLLEPLERLLFSSSRHPKAARDSIKNAQAGDREMLTKEILDSPRGRRTTKTKQTTTTAMVRSPRRTNGPSRMDHLMGSTTSPRSTGSTKNERQHDSLEDFLQRSRELSCSSNSNHSSNNESIDSMIVSGPSPLIKKKRNLSSPRPKESPSLTMRRQSEDLPLNNYDSTMIRKSTKKSTPRRIVTIVPQLRLDNGGVEFVTMILTPYRLCSTNVEEPQTILLEEKKDDNEYDDNRYNDEDDAVAADDNHNDDDETNKTVIRSGRGTGRNHHHKYGGFLGIPGPNDSSVFVTPTSHTTTKIIPRRISPTTSAA